MPPILHQEIVEQTSTEDSMESQCYLYRSDSYNDSTNQRSVACDIVSEKTNVMNTDKNITVFGVSLRTEKEVGKITALDKRNTVIGCVCLNNMNIRAEELRRLLCLELPRIPALFTFLTKKGFPVCKQQERKIKAEHLISEEGIICIQKEFDKHRIGVTEHEGESIGFVFADINCCVKQLRDSINQQLKLNLSMKSDYRFIERNGWPVMLSQETELSVMDIIARRSIYVKSCDKFSIPIGITVVEQPKKALINAPANKPPLLRRFTFAERIEKQSSIKNKGSEKRPKICKGLIAKPILISYVRAEAAEHALELKRELVKMEYSVYLDVDEIKSATDWQDELNFAIRNCFLFVPLITPGYGKTRWTNREVKLADLLGKIIVPVNFMDTWPPACLAIQFASTQYIPWKFPDSERAQNETGVQSNARKWNPVHLKRVSKLITECYRENCCKLPSSSKNAMLQPQISRRFPSKKSKEESLPAAGQEPTAEDSKTENSKQLIVISAHPCQNSLANELKALFEQDGHKVWCSIVIRDIQENSYVEDETSTTPGSPHNLPTIPEEATFFGLRDVHISNSTGDTKSSVTQSGAFEHRSATRLPSDISGIFNNDFSVTQETLDRLSTFQQNVDQAGVVIVLVSEAYTKSVFSQQQVFYCEHRKRVVLVKCDNSVIPKWFRLLMGNDIIMRDNNPQFECVLKSTVKRSLNPTTSETPRDATAEAKVNYLVNFLMKNFPLQANCVYIAGSTKLQTQRTEEICRAIGRELANMENVTIVTGGFYGASDVMAKTFCECREKSGKFPEEDSSVVHILPMHDPEDWSSRCHQNPDGSFEAVPYGKTVFLGDCLKERGSVVARLLDTCIVIEGGPAAVHEIEEFIWNDHFVIPIISTGGAAGGKYGVPVKIFEQPPGVEKTDWSILSNKEATPEEVAKAVVNIMIGIKKALTNSIARAPYYGSRCWKLIRKSNCKDYSATSSDAVSLTTTTPMGCESTDTMRSHFESFGNSKRCSCKNSKRKILKRSKWWRKIF